MNILVTGGSSGLGEAIVKTLAANPSDHVYFTYARSVEKANALAGSFDNCTAIHCDFKDQDSVTSLVNNLPGYNLDTLVNNALTGFIKQYFHKMETEVFTDSFLYNVVPTLRITQECIKLFRKKKTGRIINVLSAAIVNKPPSGWSEYVANKSYLLAMSKSWATENIRYNITSNSVSPAFMLTQLTSDEDERIVEEMIKNHPLKRLLTVEEVAGTVLYLSQAPQQMNGLNILLNAGEDIV